MKECKHNWHFIKKIGYPKKVITIKDIKGFWNKLNLLSLHYLYCSPIIIYDYYHVFVCDKCGKTKEVKEK